MSNKRNEVAEQLCHWALEDMGYTPGERHRHKPPPTPEDFKDICRGNMTHIWEYVIHHVRPAYTVQKVKGNLRLQALKSSPSYTVKYKRESKLSAEKEELKRKRKELLAKLNHIKTDVQCLQKDVNRLEKDTQDAEMQFQQGYKTLCESHHKKTLTKAFISRCRVTQVTCEEHRKLLADKHKHYINMAGSSNQETLLFSKHQQTTDNTGYMLETVCMKKMREICKLIESFFVDVLQNKPDPATGKVTKEKIKEAVRELVNQNSPSSIIKSLGNLTIESAAEIKQRTADIDVNKDVSRLGFQRSDSGFIDTASESKEDTLKSVQQLILDKQLDHIQCFMDGQKSRVATAALNKELLELCDDVDQRMQEVFGGNAGVLDLVRKVFKAELNLVATSAALQFVKKLHQDLELKAALAAKEWEAQMAKYKHIQDFQKNTDQRQYLIEMLIKENIKGKQQLQDIRKKIHRYTQTTICEHEADIVAMITGLKGTSATEFETFTHLPIDMLQMAVFADGETRPVSHLTINRMMNQSLAMGGDVMLQVYRSLRFPLYKAPEKLLPHVVKLKCEKVDLTGIITSQQRLHGLQAGSVTTGADIIQHVQGLKERVDAHDQEQNQRLGPVLQERLTEAAEAINMCMTTKSDLTAWWEQPAQHLTPWVKVDDMSFTQWLDRWIMGVTKLKEAQNQ